MAYSAVLDQPNAWIASWSEDGTTVSFDIADVAELTADEANATTGEATKCLYALMMVFLTEYNTIDDADKPVNMTITKSETANSADSTIAVSFVAQFVTSYSAQEVVTEY